MTLEVPLLGSETPVCARGLAALVRASVHYYNGETEVERFVRGGWRARLEPTMRRVVGSKPIAGRNQSGNHHTVRQLARPSDEVDRTESPSWPHMLIVDGRPMGRVIPP